MTWVAVAVGGASLIGSMMASNASQSAADTQAGAANNATATQLQMFNTINSQQAPWRQAGQTALSDLMGGAGLGPQVNTPSGSLTHTFTTADLNSNLAPNYQFQLQQGLGAVQNQANAAGGLVGGNSLKAINDYAQNFAGNAYQQAFNNYTANQSNIFNRLSNIAGLGQTANQTTAQAGVQTAANAGNAQMAAGAAQAAGKVGSANAITGGLGNVAGWYQLSNLMNPSGVNMASTTGSMANPGDAYSNW